VTSKTRGILGSLLVAIGLASTAPTAALAAPPEYLLDTPIGDRCVFGTGTASTHLNVLIKNASGGAVLNTGADVDAFGSWSACGVNLVLVPGMTITLHHGTSQRSVIVPNLTIRTDRIGNVVSGRGPAGQTVPLSVSRCDPLGCPPTAHYVADVNAQGKYSLDLDATVTQWNLVGGDEVSSEVTTAAGDQFLAHAEVPFLELLSRSVALVYVSPYRSTVTVELHSKTGAVRATKTRTATIEYSYRFEFRRNGAVVNAMPTDRIVASFSSDAVIVWPSLSFSANAGTDNVSGRCLPNAVVQVHPADDSAYTGPSAGDGSFDVAVGPAMTAGEHVAIACYRHNGDLLRGATTAN
jgi:hypothetical protein